METIVIIQSIIEKKLISLILWKNSSRQSFCQQNLIIADRQPDLRSMKIYRLLCFTTIVCFSLVWFVYKTIESKTKEVLTLFEYYWMISFVFHFRQAGAELCQAQGNLTFVGL